MYSEERIVSLYGATISVYSDGSVRNHRGTGKRRYGDLSDKGYRTILIRGNDGTHTVFVHRLVAMAFIPNPDNKPQINHKDGDKSNNVPDNLEWCTNAENQRHKREVLRHFGTQSAVLCIETGESYPSISEAARQTGTYRCGIQRSVKWGERYSTRGLHWKRIEVS